MPLIAPASVVAVPNVVARRPGVTALARSPKYVRAASAVARQELANDRASCGTTSTVSADQSMWPEIDGRLKCDGPSDAPPPLVAAATSTPTLTRTSDTARRRKVSNRTNAAAASGTAQRGAIACAWKLCGGFVTSFQATLRKSSPTVS